MEDESGWIIAERETDEGLSILRLKDLDEAFSFHSQPERINVVWSFQNTTSANTPDDAENRNLRFFEDELCGRIERDSSAVLCMVFTEPGTREFVFYAKSLDQFLDAINSIPETADGYPIEIQHESDCSGRFYHSYAKGVRDRA